MKLNTLKQQYLFGADRMLNDFLRPGDLCSTIQKEIAPKINLEDFEGIGQVRELSRIELFHETLRVFSQDSIRLGGFSSIVAERI